MQGVGILAGYVLAAVILCIALGWVAARMIAIRLLEQANEQFALLQSHQPLWQWHLRKPRDLIAGRAFGHATVVRDAGALSIISTDGTLFELGLPIDGALDLAHWPILQAQLQSSAAGTLGLMWGTGHVPTCLTPTAIALTPDTRSLHIDLRGLAWQSVNGGTCQPPDVAQMLRLRVQIPAHAVLHLSSIALWTTEPTSHAHDVLIDLPNSDIEQVSASVQNIAMPQFRLPHGISAETMLALRDELRAHWPAALIVPAGATPQAAIPTSHTIANWVGCMFYLMALAWLAAHPPHGLWRPWLEMAGCLLGPLWLVMGLHWGLYATPLAVLAFSGGLAYALFIERHHLPCLWRWPSNGRDWLWPLITIPVTLWLIVLAGHKLQPLPPVHVLTYFGWAWLQQWLMLVVLLRRLEQITGHRPKLAILAVALIFALLHAPNGMLMQLCLVAELWWAWCFLRSRSVLTVGLAHATCALLVQSGLVGGLVRSLEVSARFFL
ncbi:CPBP family intramembrane metalloprotease [Dyella sp. M7H15-1]|uniref:CPBP family intramembrane glutamic endopeptidase n=1 Tax=Dyella sp. M7H15-1 TaxID=2501295 RepID=UPI0010051D56|nr:CPBP family intramembrane glutamic endopeptidase [Dyella sp. M7H15-1]QAU22686.1 CPBP family intramembrane metalloprotease [Dyella sp. M7H15-1]